MEGRQGFFEGVDGTRLYFEQLGQGPAIVACNGVGVSTFFWKYLRAHFSKRFRFIVWDYRGHGSSGPPKDPSLLSIQTLAEDLHCLIQHLHAGPAILMGHSMGAQVILEYYRTHPESVAALVPVMGSYKRPLDTFMGSSYSRKIFNHLFDFSFEWPGWARKVFLSGLKPNIAIKTAPLLGLVDQLYCPVDDLRQYVEHLSTMDLKLFMRMVMEMAEHSAEAVLETISVPTLIVAGEHDVFTPMSLSEEMHRRIRDSEMLTLLAGSHAALVEQPERMISGLENFFQTRGL